MEKLEKLLDTAVGQYQDGLPLHLSDPTRSCRRLTLLANLLAKFKSYFERSTFLYQIANTTQILNLTRLAWTPSACLCILLKCKVSLPRFPIYISSYRHRPVRPCR